MSCSHEREEIVQGMCMGTHPGDCLQVLPSTKGLGSLRRKFGVEKCVMGVWMETPTSEENKSYIKHHL